MEGVRTRTVHEHEREHRPPAPPSPLPLPSREPESSPTSAPGTSWCHAHLERTTSYLQRALPSDFDPRGRLVGGGGTRCEGELRHLAAEVYRQRGSWRRAAFRAKELTWLPHPAVGGFPSARARASPRS